ncbi:hypothetical protein CPC08DRAFT_756337 [Agrocybe pediades]|nr:hypothetical protein CPC08DRAFT_756337 [Agrocybe pediades]
MSFKALSALAAFSLTSTAMASSIPVAPRCGSWTQLPLRSPCPLIAFTGVFFPSLSRFQPATASTTPPEIWLRLPAALPAALRILPSALTAERIKWATSSVWSCCIDWMLLGLDEISASRNNRRPQPAQAPKRENGHGGGGGYIAPMRADYGVDVAQPQRPIAAQPESEGRYFYAQAEPSYPQAVSIEGERYVREGKTLIEKLSSVFSAQPF